MRLKGKTALITGSTSGIGAAVARAFAAEGAESIVLNCPPAAACPQSSALLEELLQSGTRSTLVEGDVSNPADAGRLITQAQQFCGHIDILVNNAGIGHADPVDTMSIETWDRVIGVHLRGTFLVTRGILPAMYARGHGRIINTVSQLAYKGAPGLSAYTAAKAGVLGFTRSLVHEIGTRDIRVNCVAPGATETPILDAVPPDAREAVRASIPIGQFATTAQIAPSYVFLASSDGDHFQGQCISPNGGDVLL